MNKRAEYGGWIIFLLIVIILMAVGWAITSNSTKEPDADNDGLSDSYELKIGTDPKNPNTDGDRYPDGEDKYPLKKNNANVQIYLVKKDWSWGPAFTNALSLFFKEG